MLVFRKLREQMGLDQCRMCYTAAAPIMKQTLEFFLSLNVPVLEVFGMSESTGPHTVSLGFDFLIPSCGKDIPGVLSTIKGPDEDGNGEVRASAMLVSYPMFVYSTQYCTSINLAQVLVFSVLYIDTRTILCPYVQLCLEGRNVFIGYANNLEKSKEAFDDQNRLLTGDLAKQDDEGFIFITGALET